MDQLSGSADVEAFQIQDTTFLVFAEHVSNVNCGVDGLGDHSLTPNCQNFEINSHIFAFDSRASNPRGDCPSGSSNANITGCQTFNGQFDVHQALPTKGATGVHYFSVDVTGGTRHFLAIAENHDNNFASVNSSIWKWNGREFSLHQRIESNFATDINSFVSNNDVFLVVSNRGCPSVERQSDSQAFASCDANSQKGRARLWSYDPFQDLFVEFEESETMGTLHAYGANFLQTSSNDPEDALIGVGTLPTGTTTFQLPTFTTSDGFGAPKLYLAIANYRLRVTDRIGDCPNEDPSICYFPRNVFSLTLDVTQVLVLDFCWSSF